MFSWWLCPKFFSKWENYSVSKFDEVWIQPAAGDAGGALGAAGNSF